MIPLLVGRAIRQLLAWVDGEGDPAATARVLIDLAVATGIPAEQLSAFLTDSGAKRADLIADVAQLAKVGPRD